MITFTKTVFIDRPPQEVFEFASDPTNDAKWRDSAVSAEWISEGQIGVGSKLRSVDKLMGREIESTSEVTAWDPPNRYGQKALEGPMPFELTITLEPQDGGTLVKLDGQAEVGGFFKVAEGLVGKQLEKQIEKDLQGLKQVMEQG